MTGLHWNTQPPLTADTAVDVDEHPPSEIWNEIATSDAVQDALVDAVRTLLADSERIPALDLYDAGVSALDGGYARLVTGLDRAPETDAHQRALDLTAQLGGDGMTPLGHSSFEDVRDGPIALLETGDRTPTIVAKLSRDFGDRKRRQREATLSLLASLATACDVRLVCGGLTARWLSETHRSDLPTSFSNDVDAGPELEAPVEEIVATARSELNVDSRPVSLLRDLAEEPAETLPYDELRATHDVSAGRFSQLLGDLEALDLLERYGPRTSKRVELTPAGSSFLDALEADLGRQATLDCQFSDPGQSPTQCRDQRACEGEKDGDARSGRPTADGSAPYRNRYLGRHSHAAAAATAAEGGITTVNTPVPDVDDAEERHTRFVSYDASREEAVVAVRATGPLQYVTSIATALASPRFFDRVLPVDRLEAIDVSPEILRSARCIGGLSEEAEDDSEALRDRLVEWGEDLAAMTTNLKHGNYEDRSRYRGEILRSAHGLAGSIVHLLDAAGVDLVRELRLPDYPQDQRLAELARTLSISTAIQSSYGAFAVYRQVFEDRAAKRQMALDPEVDAADPLGEYIGGLVIRGRKADRLGQHLEGLLASPKPVHEDAPEIAVRVPISTPNRTAYAETIARMGRQKRLTSTREAVTLFRALSRDPYAVGEAMNWLGSEASPRDIRLDEIRVALAQLDHEKLLPGVPPTASKAVAVLLRTARPLTQSELADEADVSTRSLRRHTTVFEALDLVREVDDGYRFALPFATREARGEQILPEAVANEHARPDDLLFEAALDLVGDAGRLGDPDDPLGEAFFWPQDYDAVGRHLPVLNPWIEVVLDLCDQPDPEPPTVAIGPEAETIQVSLRAATPGGST